MKNKIYLILLALTTFIFSQDFNPGPYGIEYFDIAGPFTVSDLNSTLSGDLNGDEIINIQDIIIEVSFILNAEPGEYYLEGDLNSDGNNDILDIIVIINNILTPSDPDWSFEENWNDEDSYIFISYSSASGSSSLWNAQDRTEFLNNSPDNVHYFFVSDRTTYASDINTIKYIYDDLLSTLPEEEAEHWNKHLHFVPEKVSNLDNWLTDALQGRRAIGIDRFQRIKEIGYLGNPANFTGTYVSYIAHEAVYYNSEWNNLHEDDSTYDELTIWERDHYTGGWAASISTTIEFPSDEELSNYSGMAIELLRGCPDSNMNYSDSGCDEYDRIARMFICDEDGSNCLETARWITPFGRQPHHLTDISPLLAHVRPGGVKTVKFQESGWPNSLITMKFRFYHNEDIVNTPQEFIPIWNGTVHFNPDYDDNRPPTVFTVPENAQKVEFVAYLTGHGWGNATCYNCCEFCNSRHMFTVNGGTYEFERDHPDASSNNHCMSLEMIAEGTIPNQYGTWGYGRAGWCPGLDVDPYITDITDYVAIGDENIIDYSACRVSGTNCLTPPTCGTCGYCPEVAFSSYIIVYY